LVIDSDTLLARIHLLIEEYIQKRTKENRSLAKQLEYLSQQLGGEATKLTDDLEELQKIVSPGKLAFLSRSKLRDLSPQEASALINRINLAVKLKEIRQSDNVAMTIGR